MCEPLNFQDKMSCNDVTIYGQHPQRARTSYDQREKTDRDARDKGNVFVRLTNESPYDQNILSALHGVTLKLRRSAW